MLKTPWRVYDEVVPLNAEEEAGLAEAAFSLDPREGFTAQELRVELVGTVRR